MIPRPLEMSLRTLFKNLGTKKCLLAVSGGVDSMALLYVCHALKKKVSVELSVEFTVAHIHHGNDSYRDKACKLVKDVCAELEMPFATNPPGTIASGSSESDLRKFRLTELKKIKDQTASDFVIFAHHQEDLLETRLIRLIRGTGPQGLKAMSVQDRAVLRPFLTFQKNQLRAYVSLVKGRHLEDPSNDSVAYLRNWLRCEWLPALEEKRPGSRARLALSLASVVESLDMAPPLSKCYENYKIVRSEFITLSHADKRRALGGYLQQQGFKNYGLSHINELVKRLDVEQNVLTFRLLKKIWLADAKHIWCE